MMLDRREKRREAGVTITSRPYEYQFACPHCGEEIVESADSTYIDWDMLWDGCETAFCPECDETFSIYVEDYD